MIKYTKSTSVYYILCKSSEYLKEAYQLAQFTNMIEVTEDKIMLEQVQVPKQHQQPQNLYLYLDEKGLSICCQNFKQLYIEEIYTKLQRRDTSLTQELLIQAIKIKDKLKEQVMILDLTAGLARDANLITRYGYNIIMVEQNPLLATIIYYAVSHKYIDNAQIIFKNSIDYLKTIDKSFTIDAIYLDPMFKQNKSSKAKKEMQIIQQITQEDADSILTQIQYNNDMELFQQARQLNAKIVVKREHRQTPLVDNPKPTYSKLGKTIRYDVYL